MRRNTPQSFNIFISSLFIGFFCLLTIGPTLAFAALPTYVNSGSVACSGVGITPSLPAGVQTNDILLLFTETANQTITISNSNGGTWSQTADSPQGTGSLGTRLTAFWSRYNGTQGPPTTTDSGNHQCGVIAAVRGAETSGVPWDVSSGGVDATGPGTLSVTGDTTTEADRLIVAAVSDDWDNASSTRYSNWTNSDLVNITERVDSGSTSGNGGGIGVMTAEKAMSGSYGATIVSQNASIALNGFMTLALKPPAANPAVFDQNAFRVRTDDSQTLNADAGWSAALNTSASLHPDTEFRIRFEIEQSGATASQDFELWYSRNGGSYAIIPNNATPHISSSPDGQKTVQAVPSAQYVDLDATTNVLAGSGDTFVSGTGNGDSATSAISFSNPSQTELEWTIIIRKTYDLEGHNADGSTFDFRVRKSGGIALDTYTNTPRVTVLNKPGHIGGTVIETPMRYHVVDGNGNIYYLEEFADTGNDAVMMKSTDGGDSWNPMDVANNPTDGDLEGGDMDLRGDTIYISMQGLGGDEVQHWQFNVSTHPTAPDTWALVNEQVLAPVTTLNQNTAIAQRSATTVITYRGGAVGADEQIYYKIRSGGAWGSQNQLDTETGKDYLGVGMVRDSTDKIHFVYSAQDGTNHFVFMRTLSTSDTLGTRQTLFSAAGLQGVANNVNLTPPFVWNDGATERVGVSYRKADNKLYLRSWNASNESLDSEQLISDRTIENQEGGNQIPIADVRADDATDKLHAVYAERTVYDIWSDVRTTGTWGIDVEEKDAVTAHWLRSYVFTHSVGNGGADVSGYIWDNGSGGGTGKTRYDEKGI